MDLMRSMASAVVRLICFNHYTRIDQSNAARNIFIPNYSRFSLRQR